MGLGFAGVRLAWRDPTRELIDDLEIVENLESFRAIPDIKFLNDMAQLGLFTEPAAPAADEPAGDAASAPGGNAPSGESG